tara:strand:+ start:2571 stop:3137 length:567 start_codon:yes stop_codon:yes gene_type:complete
MNREEYITKLADKLAPLFESNGYALPDNIRFTCGWPSSGAGSRLRTIGQCFDPSASNDNHHEIIISMALDKAADVAQVLAHELVHAIVGVKHGHKGPFRKLALAIGLQGKMTATTAGESFTRFIEPVIAEMGEYPHKTLNLSRVKKQGTRMKKVVCTECGYTVRMTRKWLDAVGAPDCPIHEMQMTCD